MRYKLKQKLLSFGDDFTIEDEDGNPRYVVDGKVLTIGDKAIVEDMQGNEVARIEQRLLNIGKTYELLRGGRRIATVRKKLFTLFREAFDIEDAAAGDLDATGDFFDLEFRFTRDGQTIATVSKRFFALSDTYGVDIAEGEDEVLLLAATVVIDMCCHDD